MKLDSHDLYTGWIWLKINKKSGSEFLEHETESYTRLDSEFLEQKTYSESSVPLTLFLQ